MRIAISGTHASGKSTLIEAFLQSHPEFAHEPEPYEALQEEHGDAFAAEPSADDFYQQLVFQLKRLRHYQPTDHVIFERSPLDFLAYLYALHDLRRDSAAPQVINASLRLVKQALPLLDLIVVLPLTNDIEVAEWEDPALRKAVDRRLARLLDDDLDLFAARSPIVVEAQGSTAQRLKILETALQARHAR